MLHVNARGKRMPGDKRDWMAIGGILVAASVAIALVRWGPGLAGFVRDLAAEMAARQTADGEFASTGAIPVIVNTNGRT